MRRTYKIAADVLTTDCLEQTRRLHKGITGIAKKLDEQKSCALTITDLFNPSGETLRAKLKEYCVRLIIKDPLGYARKTEELLWRKAFYDIVHTSKKLRKGNTWSEVEKAMLSLHLAVGIGFYHHLILKLQVEYGLDLTGTIDFVFKQIAKSKVSQLKHPNEEMKKCVMHVIHRSLVCLGDLTRYKLELEPYWDLMIAKRYYKMAIAIDPNIGMPHNQLGTIAGNQNYGLDAVYHYMRCVLCTEPFEGAEGNLKRAVIAHSVCTNEKNSVYVCISKLFLLLQLWEYEMANSERINQQCQDLLNNVEISLSAELPEISNKNCNQNESNIELYLQNSKTEKIDFLTDDMIFKMMAICLMTISRLKTKESSEVQGVVAMTLAILSQLIQFTITKLQDYFIHLPVSDVELSASSQHTKSANAENANSVVKEDGTNRDCESKLFNNVKITAEKENVKDSKNISNGKKKNRNKTKSLLTKLRRRKRRNSSDSDASDLENTMLESSSDDINSDVSEAENDLLSIENALSEDALSDEVMDDEPTSAKKNQNTTFRLTDKKINGHIEPDGRNDASDSTHENEENGGEIFAKEMKEQANDKEEVTNFESVLQSNSNGSFDKNHMPLDSVTYMAQLKRQTLNPVDVLNIIIEKVPLASIKICCDWLRNNPDIIRTCGKSSRTLMKHIIILINLINIDADVFVKHEQDDSIIPSNVKKLMERVKIVPLPEDIDLRGLNVLEGVHSSLNWRILYNYKMKKEEETLLRVLKLVDFGHFLTFTESAGVKYEETKQLFVTVDVASNAKTNSKDSEMDHSRGKLMRHMGKLWLKAEVCALENRLRYRLMSPYLVPDHEALTKHTLTLKRLVYAKKFIVVIPSVVVSALDELKRISGRAREATRWLETQLKRGSRFLRPQRPHEHLALPFIKGPRPKDREAWLFFQIIECCHYLTQQTKVSMTNDVETPVVTLLTGCNPISNKGLTFSLEGLAKSAGVNIDYIESFHTNWKASSKSHG